MVVADEGCKFEAQLKGELLNVLVIQQLVRICVKLVCDCVMSIIAFRFAPPIGGLSCLLSYSAASTEPTVIGQCRALYDFVGRNQRELSFNTEDCIAITSRRGMWWRGLLNGRVDYYYYDDHWRLLVVF